MTRKFIGDKYATKGITKYLNKELQHIIWLNLAKQSKSNIDLDYLQVITFSKNENNLIIKQMQEEPERIVKHEVMWFPEYETTLGLKVYVIDDITHSTMLLSSEY